MIKRLFDSDRLLHLSILILCLVPITASFIMITDGYNTAVSFHEELFHVGLPCIFKTMTGYNCPSCGMTRAFIFVSHFNITEALKMNEAGVFLYFFCLFQIPYRFIRVIKPRLIVFKPVIWFQGLFLVLIGIIDLKDFIIQFLN